MRIFTRPKKTHEPRTRCNMKYSVPDGYSNAYLGEDADFVPQITNEFAVAAFRLHTLVPSKFSNMHGDQNNPEILKEELTFFKPELVMENGK